MFQNWEFLLGEIWVLIALAALLGLFAGWLIWNRTSELRRLQADLDARSAELDATKKRYDALEQEFELQKTTLIAERDSALAEAESNARQVSTLKAGLESAQADLETYKSNFHEADAKIQEQNDHILSLQNSLEAETARVHELSKAKEERDSALATRNKAQIDHAEEISRVRRRDEEITRMKTELHTTGVEAKRASALGAELMDARSKAARADELETEVAALREKAGKVDQIERELDKAHGLATRVQSLESDVSARENRIGILERELQAAKAHTQSGENQQGEIDRLNSDVRSRDVTISELRAKVAEASRPAAAASFTAAQQVPSGADYDGDGRFEGQNEGRKPAVLSAARGGSPDDLKRIKGVGPKLEALLNDLGFFHYDQVASWSHDEVAWVDANLEGFNGRVSRDQWIEQAKVLASGGSTEFASRVDEDDIYQGS